MTDFIESLKAEIAALDKLASEFRAKEYAATKQMEHASFNRGRCEKLREHLAEFVRLWTSPDDPGEIPF